MSDDDDNKGSRMDAAKAFFRAMYAGDEQPAGSGDANSASEGGSAPPADSRRVKELEQQVKDLEQQLADSEKISKRMAADFDNFRRRMDRERDDLANAGVRKAAEAIMPALDDLDRALMYLSPDTAAEKIIESFQLVATRVMQCLEQAGLKRLSTKGVLFDPRFHEPVQQIETTEFADGMIMHELRGGYLLGERVIRPALVNVASNSTMSIEPLSELKTPAAENGAEPAKQTSSVATATDEKSEEKSEETSKPQAASVSAPEADDKVYDLGDL